MGIFNSKADRAWREIYKDYENLVSDLPATDAAGEPLDKPRILRNAKLVIAYAKDMEQLGVPAEETGPIGAMLSRFIKCCDYRTWQGWNAKNFAPIMLSMVEQASSFTIDMEARGYVTAVAATGDLTQIWLSVLSSTGLHDEFMIALQEYAGTQLEK